MQNIAAITKTESTYPAFISVNEYGFGGPVEITVRAEKTTDILTGYPVPGACVSITLSREEFNSFITQMELKNE